ncbi:hypothetical protein A3G67_04535 [Candidatus Roizmanbacteria bacterium RIFCSPLOWO2_12_FULL_40_12]|uniref:Serine aminopeptidase S33 domain-containing protein n=1 Tax=Candidatus Roizmanbacteria bacterium RIFCSPLOWO2_01_FULL_40_42 TaxID=1802066 RepID=A0A1F7J4Q5_9BACT|nr:MAG: hypothetical protein A2779_04615 [Candidatus Roizmanbacteria bacterium RIFCSPHIGHO2_01_FULL_40_98]OGK27357.1 MAG: hypothetical protein A3C31_04940 [Candidatus Roizmanbacteria bacterium RIFCSPHIGHO2_02_FULL_40_53]OGK30771.1 MAG: hypothetical protein A2W49_02100 [Candidatus Roizmanbacteria bacterium RIFCSPHIGHO2_12_41_18]OGK36462.1 MAG: hypothetical protein A3E69_02565 [Candidatus Roizmanbacteria bacterium RIFCSPHIGHO2_12_FULL_40_130]OGK50590.1 MAG: hypothetical protein A3B50_02295 [Candi
MEEKVFFKTNDGLTLCGIWETPDGQTNKAIVLAHGITVDKEEEGIFTEFSPLLVQNGFAVLRFDFRGHGESEGKSVDMSIKGVLEDLGAALSEVEAKGYNSVGLVGASFGGATAALYASSNEGQLKCLCLWNPSLNYDHTFLNPITSWLKDKKERIKKDFEEKGWSTIGSHNFAIGKHLYDEMEGIFPYEALKKIDIPTLIVHGTNDDYVPFSDSEEYVKNLKNGELVTVENGEHGFQENKEHGQIAKQATINFFKKYL